MGGTDGTAGLGRRVLADVADPGVRMLVQGYLLGQRSPIGRRKAPGWLGLRRNGSRWDLVSTSRQISQPPCSPLAVVPLRMNTFETSGAERHWAHSSPVSLYAAGTEHRR
jgi:hypothetical protein